MSIKVHPIRNPDTGITDLEESPGTLGASEIPGVRAVWADRCARLSGSARLADFAEKLRREWAIETGAIENLYDIDRGVTQALIEHGFRAELLTHGSTDKPEEYDIQLLQDQKNALGSIFDFAKSTRPLSTSFIKELHAALLRSQESAKGLDAQGRRVRMELVRGDWKKRENSPVRDGARYLYCPVKQTASEMDRLLSLHAGHVEKGIPSEVQAAWLHHRLTQIRPFQDGNGRTARALASLVLVKDGLFPLLVTRNDKPAYLDALEQADAGGLRPFVDLIARLQALRLRKAAALGEQRSPAAAPTHECASRRPPRVADGQVWGRRVCAGDSASSRYLPPGSSNTSARNPSSRSQDAASASAS